MRAFPFLAVVTACAAIATTASVPANRSPATSAPNVTSVAATTVAAPSGKAMPRGNTTAWRKIFGDDFTGSKLKKPWTKYSGQPGGNPAARWKPSHVVVGNGMLHLKTYKEGGRWVSGGVGTWNGLAMSYGRVDVRVRIPNAKGVSYAMLLWPAGGGWPPEIDFAEDGGGARTSTTATLHYGSANRQIQRTKKANFAKWHTVGVRWTPKKIQYTLDGKVWGTVKNNNVPKQKMVLAIQTHTEACHKQWVVCPGSTTPTRTSLDVDWVVAYARR